MSEDSTRDIIISMLEKLTEKVEAMDARLAALEAKQYDTRPLWEVLEARLDRIEDKLDAFNNRVGNVETDLARINRKVDRQEGQRP